MKISTYATIRFISLPQDQEKAVLLPLFELTNLIRIIFFEVFKILSLISIKKTKTYLNYKRKICFVGLSIFNLLKKKRGTIVMSVKLLAAVLLGIAFLLLLYFVFKEKLAKLLVSDYG
jgi:hypothetical protein